MTVVNPHPLLFGFHPLVVLDPLWIARGLPFAVVFAVEDVEPWSGCFLLVRLLRVRLFSLQGSPMSTPNLFSLRSWSPVPRDADGPAGGSPSHPATRARRTSPSSFLSVWLLIWILTPHPLDRSWYLVRFIPFPCRAQPWKLVQTPSSSRSILARQRSV